VKLVAQAALKTAAMLVASALFTIEYPANGSFFRPQITTCLAVARKSEGGQSSV
jgi:hypothetical protein